MDNLTLHIEYLLLRHDCVVVPGIGAFINVRHAAHYDKSNDTWHPMSREVRFNGALVHDDGLLANSYARKYQVSYNEGRETLRRTISNIRGTLDAEGELTLGHLGILRRNEESLSFEPGAIALHSSEMLGYRSFKKGDSKRASKIETEKESHEERVSAQQISRKRFDTTRNYYIPVNKIFAKTAAVALLLSVTLLTFIIPGTERTKEDRASVVPVEKILPTDFGKSFADANNNKGKDVSTSAESTLEKLAGIEAATKDAQYGTSVNVKGSDRSSDKYQLIVATFKTPAEAERFVRERENSGYDLEVISTKSMSRVSAYGSGDKESLLTILNGKAFREKFGEAWIWEQK